MSPGPKAQPLALLGASGVGKTTVGRRVAELVAGVSFHDLDELVVGRAGASISPAQLFSRDGPESYLEASLEVIDDICETPSAGPALIAVGAGACAVRGARVLLNRCFCVAMTAPAETLVHRNALVRSGRLQPNHVPPLDAETRNLLRDAHFTLHVGEQTEGESERALLQLVTDLIEDHGWDVPGVGAERRRDLDGSRLEDPASGRVFLIDRGCRRHVPNPEVYARLFTSWSGISRSPEAGTVREGPPLDVTSRLVLKEGEPHLFLSEYGIVRHVSSPAVLVRYHLDSTKAVSLSADHFSRLLLDAPLV